ncbi:MAG TPA: toxin-antitoxin system HicB family antitoxin [Conexibacter sp.]|nr:toxin-antitoxin system HicB family antitoxin [Conexibacter sp.]
MKQLILRVSPDLHRRIAARAAREGKSVNAWVTNLLERVVDADVAEDRQARADAKAAELGMLVVYDDIPEYDEEALRRGEEAWRELGPEIVRILEEDRNREL